MCDHNYVGVELGGVNTSFPLWLTCFLLLVCAHPISLILIVFGFSLPATSLILVRREAIAKESTKEAGTKIFSDPI